MVRLRGLRRWGGWYIKYKGILNTPPSSFVAEVFFDIFLMLSACPDNMQRKEFELKQKNAFIRCILVSTFILLLGILAVSQAVAAPKTLRIVNSYKCASIDPARSGSVWLFDWAIADTYMQVDEDGNIKPNVLKSLDRIDDLNWKLVLREDVYFQNGKQLNAEAAAKNINRQLEKSKSTQLILGGCTAKATGPFEVVMTTPTPNASVPRALAARNASLFIYDADVLDAAAGDSSKIVGAGAFTAPYAIAEYTPEYFKTGSQ